MCSSDLRRPGPGLGVAQDGNAAFLRGMAGHAGLFGSVEDLARFARFWCRAIEGGEKILPDELARRSLPSAGKRGIGWARPNAWGLEEEALSDDWVGHVGFAGGSFWIDPASSRVIILLGHRTSARSDLGPSRRRFLSLAARLFKGRRSSGRC